MDGSPLMEHALIINHTKIEKNKALSV